MLSRPGGKLGPPGSIHGLALLSTALASGVFLHASAKQFENSTTGSRSFSRSQSSQMGAELGAGTAFVELNAKRSVQTELIALPRFCWVATYGNRKVGIQGGIGARDDGDYDVLEQFVANPQALSIHLGEQVERLRCFLVNTDTAQDKTLLVVFDYDETITIETYVPNLYRFKNNLDWTVDELRNELKQKLIDLSFGGSERVDRLRAMLQHLQAKGKTLAVLTRNQDGATAVLNLDNHHWQEISVQRWRAVDDTSSAQHG